MSVMSAVLWTSEKYFFKKHFFGAGLPASKEHFPVPSSHPGALSDVAIQHSKLALFKDNLIGQELDGVPQEQIKERD